jgi:hypothetical protein
MCGKPPATVLKVRYLSSILITRIHYVFFIYPVACNGSCRHSQLLKRQVHNLKASLASAEQALFDIQAQLGKTNHVSPDVVDGASHTPPDIPSSLRSTPISTGLDSNDPGLTLPGRPKLAPLELNHTGLPSSGTNTDTPNLRLVADVESNHPDDSGSPVSDEGTHYHYTVSCE